MTMHQGSTALRLGVPLAAAMLVLGCASAPPKWERFVAPPVGTGWTYAQNDTGSFGSGTTQVVMRVGEATWEGRPVTSYQTSAQHLLLDAGSFAAITTPTGQMMMRWDPPIGYQWPLEVGKTWTKDYTMTVGPSGQKVPFSTTWKVEAYEDVTVPAGTFKAWRVSYSDTGGTTQMLWSTPEVGGFVKRIERRSAAFQPSGAGTRETELVSMTLAK